MNFLEQLDWQTAIALVIVFAAIGVLVRKLWKMVWNPSSGGCGSSCNNCSTSTESSSLKVTKLVQLDSPPRDV
jgi:hypothetical protein